jgi:hypothetical protein
LLEVFKQDALFLYMFGLLAPAVESSELLFVEYLLVLLAQQCSYFWISLALLAQLDKLSFPDVTSPPYR